MFVFRPARYINLKTSFYLKDYFCGSGTTWYSGGLEALLREPLPERVSRFKSELPR